MDGPRSRGYGARSGYDVRTRRLRGGPEGRDGVNGDVHTLSPGLIQNMRREMSQHKWRHTRRLGIEEWIDHYVMCRTRQAQRPPPDLDPFDLRPGHEHPTP